MRTLLLALLLAATCLGGEGKVLGKAWVVVDDAPIRRGTKVLAKAKKGEGLEVTDVEGDFLGVGAANGWIHRSSVQFVPSVPLASLPGMPQERGSLVLNLLAPKLPRQASYLLEFENGVEAVASVVLQQSMTREAIERAVGKPDRVETGASRMFAQGPLRVERVFGDVCRWGQVDVMFVHGGACWMWVRGDLGKPKNGAR